MALSQVQCLDDNHVNPRTHESKPEFLYCEDQRLALEAFMRDGREAFGKYLCARGLRGFLSDPELETLAEVVEPYDPGAELFFPENAEEGEPPLSLHYWPELSDTSVPQMDLSWPENVSYRGVTRTTVYAQPPLEGQVHIKEVVRKMIAQAQKVIAVVMDVFTDVDIFRDLLDAGFKRKVSVYILLERTTLPHFQSMCQRANMHGGHLKNLRVRCTDGVDFYSRSCTKVRGRMGHRFMFIDGDKAVSGSYSFTWMSSRLDKNLITVVTGQAVEAFDRLFRILYATSSSVDLRQVTTEPEPELEPVPLPVPVAAISADMARKLNSPKYAMVALSSPVPAAGLKETQDAEKKGRQMATKEPIQDPPLHPGLILEKVCMMAYLPTWPEPDPPSDVIGFINVRDTRKPNQVHLQRSEMFETSQAIRFSSPFSMPKETLPDVAKPRQVAGKHEETNKLQPAREEAKADESVVDGAQPTQRNAVPAEATGQKPPASGPKCESDTATTLGTENKQHSKNTPADQDARTPRQPSSQACPPDAGSPSQSTRPLPGSNVKREAGSHLNAECDVSYRTHAPQEPDLRPPIDSDTQPHAQAKAVPPPSTPSPTVNNTSSPTSTSVSSSSLSENSHVSATASRTIIASSPLSSSSIPPLTSSSSTTPNPPLPSPTPPVPKPRTVQLVMKGGAAGEGQEPPEFSIVRKLETSTGVCNEPAVTAAARTSPENVPETVPEPQSDSGGKTGAREAPQREQSGTSRETKTEAADGRRESAATQSAAGNKAKSDVLITDAPKAESVNIQEIIPTDVEPETLMSTDCKLTPQIERVAAVRTETKAPERHPTGCESSAVPNENRESVSECKTYLARAHAAQRISYSELSPKDAHVLETVDSLKAPVFSTHSADAQGSQGNQSFTPNTATHNAHGTFQEQIPQAQASTHTTERPQRLHLFDSHVPDFRSPMPERDSRSLLALVRTPTPEGFLPHTPDSRTHTPDSRTSTSDEYMSPRTDSALSTNSEEFYECSDYSSLEPVFDRASFRNHQDYVSFTHANTVENGREDDGRGSVADHLKQGKHSTATEEENQEALASKRKRVLNQSVDAGATPGELTNERTGPMPSSTGDLQPRKSSSERNRPDKEMAVDRGALGPSGAERRDTDRQKLFHSLPKTPRGQQRDREASSSPSRPSRPPPRPLSTGQAPGPRPWGSRQPSQAESKMFHGGFQNADYTSSPRRPPSRPPPPGTAGAVWPAGGRKQDEVARGHQSLFSRQPPQGKTRAGPLQNQYPFPKAEASQSQTVSPQEAHWQDEGKNPFSLTVSRLYKVSKLPAQSKGGSASSTGQGRKSTS